MLVVEKEEYGFLLDWVKQKLGMGYAKLKTFTNQRELKEAKAVLTGLGIKHYTKCSNGRCDLYVEAEKYKEAYEAVSRIRPPVIATQRRGILPDIARLNIMIPIVALAIAIPLIILLLRNKK